MDLRCVTVGKWVAECEFGKDVIGTIFTGWSRFLRVSTSISALPANTRYT